MQRLLRGTLMTNSIVMALLLVSNGAFAEPLPLPLSEVAGHGMLETSPAQSPNLHQAGLKPKAAASAKPSIAPTRPSEWITAPQPPVQLDKPSAPGLRF